jgi:hypothetical protein
VLVRRVIFARAKARCQFRVRSSGPACYSSRVSNATRTAQSGRLALVLLLLSPAVAVAGTGCGTTPPAPSDAGDRDGGTSDAETRLRTRTPGPTGATCPDGSSLTYETFGEAFFEAHCFGCHHSSLTGTARNGAPADANFDQIDAVRARATLIDRYAAGGPERVNLLMPLGTASMPTDAERDQLGEWIACGAP